MQKFSFTDTMYTFILKPHSNTILNIQYMTHENFAMNYQMSYLVITHTKEITFMVMGNYA